ncbi:MAG: hypothetical protein OYH76_23080 [Defluviicoccus sp.]|nr:hypothetical protein [Defluviicoccus sp.]MDE0278790.1 hypothetical protein [Defluviicoccus sp.]
MTPEFVDSARSIAAAAPPPAPNAESCLEIADEAQKRAIARAVWTDLLWLMPPDRTVTVTVRDGRVHVELGPAEASPAAPAHA